MMLPGNGCPVRGSRIGVVTWEKFPCRMSAVGTEAMGLWIASARTPSYATMKNVRFLPLYSPGIMRGPSSSAPNCLLDRGFLARAGLSK